VSDRAQGELVVIATPIGNLGDVTVRARELLGGVDLLCCEDTRTTGKLLSLLGIAPPRLLSLHEHNEAERANEIVERLRDGQRVGLVCDAGTPLLSDPGGRVVSAAIGAGFAVVAAPGASAALGALVVSGFGGGRFRFEGFLPRKGKERAGRVAAVVSSPDPVVLYEAPRRVLATLADLARACDGERLVAISRELTKLHEQTWQGPLAAAVSSPVALAQRGEYVVVISGAPETDDRGRDLGATLDKLATAGLSRHDAVAALEVILGVSHRVAYDAALAHRGFPGSGWAAPEGVRIGDEGQDPVSIG